MAGITINTHIYILKKERKQGIASIWLGPKVVYKFLRDEKYNVKTCVQHNYFYDEVTSIVMFATFIICAPYLGTLACSDK